VGGGKCKWNYNEINTKQHVVMMNDVVGKNTMLCNGKYDLERGVPCKYIKKRM